ncbi:MAG: ferritin-like domain-containing protein [Sphingomonas sp.]|nr:ferritin-like domain-containing protein [Sphingomonas sp.]
MLRFLQSRYLELIGSIYIYNEHRGYTAIDQVLRAVRARWPEDLKLIAEIEKHRGDEQKHYLMFRRWFERRGVMPFKIDRACGHIDRFIEIMFGARIDELQPERMIGDGALFARLCRIISLTEKRGYRQVEILLRNRIVQSDRGLMKIFRIIEADEPSHWAPYDGWLEANAKRDSAWWERALDRMIHSELLLVKLPFLFFSSRLPRRADWADEHDDADRLPGKPFKSTAAV